MIESTLDEELMKICLDEEKLFLTILTYVKVDSKDPAFKNPTKPIGPAYPVRTRPGQRLLNEMQNFYTCQIQLYFWRMQLTKK
ncbi:MAG: hypothetical protein V3V33_12040 [Candidatus Lokiarchaeia archaeon]